MKQAAISVVIPVYNKLYKLRDCLSSLASQSVSPEEVIFVNDGSIDGSGDELERLVDDLGLTNAKIIHQANQGVSAARNNGVSLASHEYIAFLDADDEWSPEFIVKMKLLISDFPDASLFCLAHEVFRSGKGLYTPKHGMPFGYRGYVDDFCLASSKGSIANSSKVCVRKSDLNAVGGFPVGEKLGEDLFVWIQLSQTGRVACDMTLCAKVNQIDDSARVVRFGNVPYPLKYYSRKENSGSLDNSLKKYLDKIFVLHFGGSIRDLKYREAAAQLKFFFRISPFKAMVYSAALLIPPPLLKWYSSVRKS